MAKPMPERKTVPVFRTEDEEREFWATADSTEYVDWSKARSVTFPNLKPTRQPSDNAKGR